LQLEALGDSTRRAILGRLAQGSLPVGELAAAFPISRPAISQHLRILKNAGLVADRRAGTRNVYALDPLGIAALREYLDDLWDKALAAFKQRVESADESQAPPHQDS
jgi:DNA-binding transcriptional ArsR family regulator